MPGEREKQPMIPGTVAISAKSTAALPKTIAFGSAGMGGILGWLVIHPANTVAVRLNLFSMANPTLPSPTFLSFFKDLVKKEGAAGLYAGLGAGVLRQVFYATSRFGLFEVFRDKMAEYRETDVWSRLLTGCASGGIAALISCPCEVSLVRMSNDRSLPLDMRRNYGSVFNCGKTIMREEGFGAFYRGCAPFVNRALLVGCCQVGTYDQFKTTYKNLGVTGKISNVFCAAMSSGLIYSVVTNPLETAKNRMAFQSKDSSGKLPYTGTVQTLKKIASEEGASVLWRGFPAYYTRCGGHTVMMFIFVEAIRDQYRAM